jgi:hypothetical protein
MQTALDPCSSCGRPLTELPRPVADVGHEHIEQSREGIGA